MLKKKERLSRTGFDTVYTTGRRFTTPHLTVITAPRSSGACAVVVSKKTARNAVVRNTARRRLYIILKNIHPLWASKGVVVVLKRNATQCEPTHIRREIETALVENNKHL